jgi:hypothetical protein
MEKKANSSPIGILTNNAFGFINGTIITSDDDDTIGTCCPICKKTGFRSMDISNTVKVVGDWAGQEHQKWLVNGCLCVSCHSFWMLFDNQAGRRMVIYEGKRVRTAGAY